MTGLLSAAALVLVLAAVPKLLDPAGGRTAVGRARVPLARLLGSAWGVRATAVAELLVVLSVVLVGGRVAAAAVAVTFLALAAFAWRLAAVAPGSGCGCFGSSTTPVSSWHVGTDLALAAAGLAALVAPGRSLVAELAEQPLLGAPLLLLVALLASACVLLMTTLPAVLQAARPLETP